MHGPQLRSSSAIRFSFIIFRVLQFCPVYSVTSGHGNKKGVLLFFCKEARRYIRPSRHTAPLATGEYHQACRSYVLNWRFLYMSRLKIYNLQIKMSAYAIVYVDLSFWCYQVFSIYNSIHGRHFQMKIVKYLQKTESIGVLFNQLKEISSSDIWIWIERCKRSLPSGKIFVFFSVLLFRSCSSGFRMSERMKFCEW